MGPVSGWRWCNGLEKQHGGYIDIESSVGIGTTIYVYFPWVGDGKLEERVALPQPEPRAGSETILFVEDQEPLRRAGERILRDYGYTAYTSGDDEEGIIEAGRHMGEIDLIIADVVMSNVGGQELFAVVRGQSQPLDESAVTAHQPQSKAVHSLLVTPVHSH